MIKPGQERNVDPVFSRTKSDRAMRRLEEAPGEGPLS